MNTPSTLVINEEAVHPSAGALLPDSASSALVQPLARTLLRSRTALDLADSSGAGSDDSAAASINGSMQNGNDKAGREDEAGAGILLVWSDRPRALSQRERMWAAAVAAKLYMTLC